MENSFGNGLPLLGAKGLVDAAISLIKGDKVPLLASGARYAWCSVPSLTALPTDSVWTSTWRRPPRFLLVHLRRWTNQDQLKGHRPESFITEEFMHQGHR